MTYTDFLQVYRTRSKAVSSKPIFNAGTERFVRDWRTAIVTVTVRDQRNRQHDPILGVVPLRLTDILTTSSQVTRWYPLDGGVGFGRIRISLLWRSVETRLPPNMLGWNVGTFEFMSDRLLATGYNAIASVRMRTGGSSGRIPKRACSKLAEGDGYQWDLEKKDGKYSTRLPVKHRYRSPVVFEFHNVSTRGPQAYAIIWLHHLIDNEPTEMNIPIWTTKNGARLTQNYVTEENLKAKEIPGLEDLKEVGRLQFRAQFKAGTDESHEHYVVDNATRETFETWEACKAEGVRQNSVEAEVPDRINELHEQSLTEGRDILKQADPKEQKRWLSKDGTDWSGAFGHDPKAYTKGGRKAAEPGRDDPPHDPHLPSDDDDSYISDNDDSDSSDEPDLGVSDAQHGEVTGKRGTQSMDTGRTSIRSDKEINAENKRTEKRTHRGLMQWKPVRNAAFAADNAKYAARRMKGKITGTMSGREPDVETEA